MHIFHFKLIDLDLWNAFCEVSPCGSFLFTLQRQKKVCTPGDEAVMKIHLNYFLVYQLISPFLVYLQNYKEFEAEILALQSEKYGLSFDIKKYTTSGWALGDENVIGIRAFKPLILMILVLEDRYESPLSIDTKKVPVALHLQWWFNDARVKKNWILRILDENRPNLKFSPKILGICDFDGVFD